MSSILTSHTLLPISPHPIKPHFEVASPRIFPTMQFTDTPPLGGAKQSIGSMSSNSGEIPVNGNTYNLNYITPRPSYLESEKPNTSRSFDNIHLVQGVKPQAPGYNYESPKKLGHEGTLSIPPLVTAVGVHQNLQTHQQAYKYQPLAIGGCSIIGSKPSGGLNQDCVRADMLDEFCWLYCVFDGHGDLGELASSLSCRMVFDAAKRKASSLKLVQDEDGTVRNIPDMQEMAVWFHSTFTEVVNQMNADPISYATSGTSASVAFHIANEVFIAHCGDSRVAIAEWTKQTPTQAPCWRISELTKDHRWGSLTRRASGPTMQKKARDCPTPVD
eukprot:Platyproteum_vivax@DN6461_c0_g1_i1.p1